MIQQTLNLIGGEFAPPSTGKWFDHENPATGEVQAQVPDSSVLDVVRAIQAANKAWTTWQKVEAEARAHHINAIADAFEKRAGELAAIQSRDQGLPITVSQKHSLPRVIELFRASARLLLEAKSDSALGASTLFYGNRLPIGVVAILTPWSDPMVSMASRVAPALAAGNVVIVKPSEHAPESAHAFAETILSSGLPPGVFNMVQGRGETAGATIVSHPGLSTLSFIGRTDTGRTILRESSEFLKRTHLALGARNPILVFAETDLEKTVPLVAEAALQVQGATCLRGSRLFIQETIYDKFLELFKAHLEKLVIGDPLDAKTQVGPLVSKEERKRYIQAIEQALGEKGKLLVGGVSAPTGLDERFANGNFVAPTVVYDLTLCSTLQQEEVVGPFVTVASFKYQHDAIKQANNSPLGQAAYLFHKDASKAARIAQKIEAGRVFINTGAPLNDERMSFGGLKASGLGREGALESLNFFSRQTLIAQNISG